MVREDTWLAHGRARAAEFQTPSAVCWGITEMPSAFRVFAV